MAGTTFKEKMIIAGMISSLRASHVRHLAGDEKRLFRKNQFALVTPCQRPVLLLLPSYPEVEDFYRKVLMWMFAVFVHRITNEIIDIKDETHATGRWYLGEPCILQETKRAAWS